MPANPHKSRVCGHFWIFGQIKIYVNVTVSPVVGDLLYNAFQGCIFLLGSEGVRLQDVQDRGDALQHFPGIVFRFFWYLGEFS